MSIPPTPPTPLGESPAFLDMLAHVSRLAPLDRPVLVVGERGTGKELIAARLAYLSPRWDRPFVTLNCAALAESLLDSELFGHEAGAFTSASRRRAGRFESADGGSLFLDEIATASFAVQEKLLRAIEYGSFARVGGNETLSVDVRVIAATNADLPALAEAGRFRADLLDRLAFDVVRLPPLRERSGDIVLLAQHFATGMTAALGRAYFPGFAPAALAALTAYPWPGNVRELRNAVERSVCRAEHPERELTEVVIDPFAPRPAPPPPLPPPQPPPSPAASPPARLPLPASDPAGEAAPPERMGDLRAALHALEGRLLAEALSAARFNQRRAAASLGLGYDQFRQHLRHHPALSRSGK